jgi:hypothetical protein
MAASPQAAAPLPPEWLQEQAKTACTTLAAKPTTPTASGGYGWP